MTKDLLSMLKGNAGDIDDHSSYDSPIPTDPHGYMDSFLEDATTLRRTIGELQSKVDEVKERHKQILTAPQQDPKFNRQVEELMDSIKSTARVILLGLKKMEQSIRETETSNPNSTTLRIRRTQHDTMLHLFKDCMEDYNKAQLNHQDACKSRLKRQLEIANRSITDEELDNMLESGNPQIFTQGIMSDTVEARQNLADIEARHSELIRLENSLRELRDMFVEIGTLVSEQGEQLNRIDVNVEQTVTHIDEAKIHTKQAVIYQKSARKKKIIIIAVCVGLGLVLLAILLGVFIPRR